MTEQSQCRPEAIRRLFDLTCSAVSLVLLSPLLGGLSLAILLSDGWPIFFRQIRVGQNGTRFRILKFRTMRAGASGKTITAEGDDRVTRLGALLRRYKLDELPQLLNILAGEMSLVGPRPEVPEYVQLDTPIWRTVLRARPGLTDLATLIYRDEEKLLAACGDSDTFYRENLLPDKLALNVVYLGSRSFWQDMRLILLTIRYSLIPAGFDPQLIKRAFNAGHLDA